MAIPAEVGRYLDAVAPDRLGVLREVFDVVAEAMPDGYELGLYWGIPSWVVPLAVFPDTYNGDPLAYVSLAARKNGYSLYLMWLYSAPDADRVFRERWTSTGRRLDMGKSCLRFRRLDDLDLGLIRDTVASTSVEEFLATYRRIRTGGS